MNNQRSLRKPQPEMQPAPGRPDEFLDMALLGGVTLTLGGEPLTGLASRRTVALLIYLACTRRSHSREALANLLWDEGEQRQLLGNLRVLLSSLRQTVGAHLIITRHTATFNLAGYHRLDVAMLEADLATVRSQKKHLLPAALDRLASTIRLYQGDFLDGFHLRGSQGFEEWQLMERERLRLHTIEAIDYLVAAYLALGDYATALEQAQRLIQLDPLRETTHRQLMRLFAASGQRSTALAQYETCCRILISHLGVIPLPETTALYEQIRAGTVLTATHNDILVPEGGPELVSSPLDRMRSTVLRCDWHAEPHSGAFYGRQDELARLEHWLVTGRCRVVAVVGMSGMGKTALVAQAARGERSPGGALFRQSPGIEVGSPYHPRTL